jgi:hypothetical protein
VSDLKHSGELIEQDHRRVKQRLRPMLGLKSLRTAAVVIGGIELAEKIKKGQFKIGKRAVGRPPCRRSGKLPWLRNELTLRLTIKTALLALNPKLHQSRWR